MDYSKTFAISAAGMAVERARVDIAALNLANANTVQSPEGGGYQPMRAVARSMPAGMAASQAFSEQMAQAGAATGDESAAIWNLPQVSIEPDSAAPRLVYEPGHPLANAKGFVAYAGVDSATEMVDMMSALRSYEANVAAMNMAKTLALRALDIGSGS
jgi:flagellar basal-body rod protein FlgC